MDIVQRLKRFMDFTGLSSSQFADTALIPRPTLSQITNGRNKKISNELIAKLHEAFPQLNILWLMFGDGPMTLASETDIDDSHSLFNSPESSNEEMGLDAPNNSDLSSSDQHKNIASLSDDLALDFNISAGNKAADKKRNLTGLTTPDSDMHTPNNQKSISYIMVFYSDNSFEVFNRPTGEK